MKILGLSFGFHDSSIVLLDNEKIVYAVSEEMYTRKKHDFSFPLKSIEKVFERLNITIDDIDKVVYYEDNLLKLERILTFCAKDDNIDYLKDTINLWLSENRIDLKEYISNKLGIEKDKIFTLNHHLSHAASAFFASGFKDALIITFDGVGEFETITVWEGKDLDLKKIDSYELPDSLGLFYSAFTSFLGFEVNEGEYKVMGMAPYGTPKYLNKILKTIKIDKERKRFHINPEYFNFTTPTDRLYTKKFLEVFGKPREKELPFFTKDFQEFIPNHLTNEEINTLIQRNEYYADIASSVQKVTEDIILMIIENHFNNSFSKNLCLSGGVALNSVANGIIRKKIDPSGFFIQPAAGDAGSAMGAALFYAKKKIKLESALLGEEFDKNDILKAIEKNIYLEEVERIDDLVKFLEKVSQLLLEQKVIGWFYGRFEWGPRALGSRSIIADPRDEKIKLIINEKVKYREPFRPFAPSVLFEEAHKWFEIKNNLDKNAPENFMLTVTQVKEEVKDKIKAVVHIDGTARIQLVRKEINPVYYQLIKNFYEKSKVPIILNTSFNLKGEPIVRDPNDAIRTFSYSKMDYLAIYPYLIKSYWND